MPLISDSVGRVLGKRYRLVSALGAGASAHVFLAEDVSLERLVAVKVLQPALVDDAAFLKRFRAEARSVASLNHPHVLRVFDWGDAADGPYLVLEYLGGGSLREVLDRGFRLSHAQATRLGIQVAQGLAYAHARGLVHRDVKPANLLFDEEGRVRVADFGVARALAEAAWTEPAGAMVGTARYAAPEQAQGKPVDGRADVYALSLVLYESVTGEVPFVADTTVGTLMARVGAPLPRHPELGPLDDVLARGAAPDAAQRLDAAGFAARLEAVAASLPAPAPLPLRPPVSEDASRTVVGFVAPVAEPTVAPGRPSDPDPANGSSPKVFDVEAPSEPGTTVAASAVAAGVVTSATPPVVKGPYDVEAPSEPGATPPGGPPAGSSASRSSAAPPPPVIARRTRRRWWPWITAAVVLALLIAGGAIWATKDKVFTPSHPVPVLTGLTVTAAQALAAKDHFTVQPAASTYSKTAAAGIVLSQTPAPTTSLKEGSHLTVVPSKGPPPVAVPSLTGLTCTSATPVLAALGLKISCPALEAYSSTVPAGDVINWSYNAGLNPTTAPYGGTIAVAISKGPAPVPVPSIPSSDSFAQAQATLQAAGFAATESRASSTTVPSGQVIGTSPAAGALVQPGSTINVSVSTGPPTVAVPNLGGDSVATATAALQAAGLSVGTVYGPSGGNVFTSIPASGATVNVGSSVTLYTSGH